eukprot:3550890-Amphidinium_carterae.1
MGIGRAKNRSVFQRLAMGAVAMGAIDEQTTTAHEQLAGFGFVQAAVQLSVLPANPPEPDLTPCAARCDERSESSDWRRISDNSLGAFPLPETNSADPAGVSKPSAKHEETRKRQDAVVAMPELPQQVEASALRGPDGYFGRNNDDDRKTPRAEIQRDLRGATGLRDMGHPAVMDSGGHAPQLEGLCHLVRESGSAGADTERNCSQCSCAGAEAERNSHPCIGNHHTSRGKWSSRNRKQGHSADDPAGRELGTIGCAQKLDRDDGSIGGDQRRRRGGCNDADSLRILWQNKPQVEAGLAEWVQRQLTEYSDWGESRTLPRKVRKCLLKGSPVDATVPLRRNRLRCIHSGRRM